MICFKYHLETTYFPTIPLLTKLAIGDLPHFFGGCSPFQGDKAPLLDPNNT